MENKRGRRKDQRHPKNNEKAIKILGSANKVINKEKANKPDPWKAKNARSSLAQAQSTQTSLYKSAKTNYMTEDNSNKST